MRRTALLTIVSLMSASLTVAQTQGQASQSQPPQQSIGAIPPAPAPDGAQQDSQQPSFPQNEPQQNSTPPQNSGETNNPPPANYPQSSPGQNTGVGSTQGRQTSPDLGARPGPVTRIPMARTVQVVAEVNATLDTPLSSRTSQVDQPFTATLTQALRNNNGEVLVPIGTKVRGKVGSAAAGKTLPSLRGKGQLTLRFTDLELANGGTVPIQASLLGVTDAKGGKQSADTNEEGQVTGKTTGTNTAKDVGIGAGVGTLAGIIFGGALKGLAIGAIAGGGYVLANGGKDVELPANTGLRLRLDQNVTLPAGTNTGTAR
jgi:hypothetical protein